jgi:spermidine synthase
MEGEKKQAYLPTGKIIPLWMLVFFNGWFIMQIELVGARSLTPYFGNSIFVWGSVLAVFMLALAIGYGAGGRLTRRCDSHWASTILLVAAGALVGLSLLYHGPLCTWLAGSGIDVRWGALIASVLLYSLPMVLSGMISPFSVHLATGARSEAGSKAGSLYAVSTLGSFIGSLVTSFVLVPSYSLEAVTLGGGVLAALTAVVAGASLSVGPRPAAGLSIGFAAAAMACGLYVPGHFEASQQQVYAKTLVGKRLSEDAPSTLRTRQAASQKQALIELAKHGNKPGEKTLLKLETVYHRVSVTQDGPIRQLTFGEAGYRAAQTTMNLNNINAHTCEYTEVMLAPILYKPHPKRVLLIGLGGGDVARAIETCYPDVTMDVVEIDPAVVRVAQDYFFWKPSRNVTVYTMDGRSFVNMKIMTNAQPYDWVLIDAFDEDYVPFHLTTIDFFGPNVLQRIMVPDGVVSVNTWILHKLYSFQARTIKSAFGGLDPYFCHRSGNVILVAQKGSKHPMTQDRAHAGIERAGLSAGAAVDLRYIVSCLLGKPNWDEKGGVLTDAWAPVESLLRSD